MHAANLARWEFLQPFYRALRSGQGVYLVPARAPTTLEYRLHAFEFNQSYADRERVASVRDAVELLLLQSIVDRRAFLEMVLHWVPLLEHVKSLVLLDDPHAPLPCKLRVICEQNCVTMPGKLTAFLSELLLPRERASGFQAARSRITSLIDSVHKLDDAERIRRACAQLTISVEVVFRHSALSSSLLRELVQLQQLPRQQTSGDDRSYQVDTMSVRVNADKIDEEDMVLLHDMVSNGDLGLENGELWYSMGPRQPRASTRELAKALAALNDPQPSNRKSAGTSGRLVVPLRRSFKTRVYRYDTGFRQICSSLMVSQDIQSATLDLYRRSTGTSRTDQDRFLVWVFHTLFSRSSTHTIRHVSIPVVPVSNFQADEMQRFSQCANPAAFLYDPKIWGAIDLASECQRPPRRVTVVKGTPLTFKSSSSQPHQLVGQLQETISCDVLYESKNKSVHVLVPGYGHCRVPPTGVLWHQGVPASPSPSLRDHCVKSLTMNGSWSGMHEAGSVQRYCSLIALIGGPLEEIEIENCTPGTTTLLRQILAACPLLKSVRLGYSTTCDYWFWENAYRKGECKATTLDLMRAHTSLYDDGTSLLRFFDALSDQTNRISTTVEQLSVKLKQRDATDDAFLYEETLRAVEKMLDSNRTLRVLSLDVGKHEAYRLFTPLRLRHHDSYFRADPLPIKAKCALLSALRRNADDVMAQLDSFVVSLIFELAATPIKRVVTIRHRGEYTSN